MTKAKEVTAAKLLSGVPAALYDIGVGNKSEWKTFSEIFPSLRVFGCEPEPDTFRKLKKEFPGPLANVAICENPGTVVLNVPLGWRACSSIFSTSTSILRRGRYEEVPTEVVAWTLDQFDEFVGEQEDILLWLDIEGAELSALSGGTKLLGSGRVKWINVEERLNFDAPGWYRKEDMISFLGEYGYRRHKEYNTHKTHHDVIYNLIG